ncbi:MAG: RDD family protein [Saprospiraceae bacterium]|nr:RDD family protein [Saprospiraceae bacterium]
MAEIAINTTQNVNINFIAASVGMRMGAYLLDLTVKYAYLILIFQLVFPALGIRGFQLDYWSEIALQMIFYLPVIFYTLTQEIFFEGQTLGKRIIGIKVVKIDGYQASVWDHFLRWIFRVVDIIGPFWIVGLITMSGSKKIQRLGDIAAGTAVISLKSKININHTILQELALDYKPVFPAVVMLSDNDIRIIKENYLPALKKKDFKTIQKLAEKICSVTGISSEMSDARFIDTVLKDYNYYTGE